MATFGKWQGDTCIQGGSYIQVNFAENIKHLKILGSFLVTVRYRVTAIYRAVIYRFECSVINFVRNSVRQHPIKREQHVLTLQFYRQCTCTFSVHKVFLGLITSCCSGNDSTLLPQKTLGGVCLLLPISTNTHPAICSLGGTKPNPREWQKVKRKLLVLQKRCYQSTEFFA